ncbi:hypothetical protein E8E12_001291 [Didymella heteroderae]|uniref:Uncharacterized protein n=1 Tax=Didymella heteroderae TaxID=1769908 RepID=A0A9P5BW53_9PLEO|nr:hypothetical protein E8E12_001291 [Didymella heteroderae]
MPPRIPVRASWAPSAPASCLHVRQFASTPAALALGPQSPNYIEVPKPAQPTFPIEPDVKGHLPIPRDITKTRSQHANVESFLRRTTKDAKDRKAPGPFSRDADFRLYKQRLAEARKEALKEGVKELHARKVTSEAQHLDRIQKSGELRRKLATAPRRDVDILTETSVSKGVRDFLAGTLPAPEKNIEARRRAYEKRMAAQEAVRQSRLHDLYTNARTFIVSEEQLDQAIDEAFGTDDNPVGWNMKGQEGRRQSKDGSGVGGYEGLSPWTGPMPEGVGDKMQKLRGGEGVGLAKERVKKLAEELTGGKM